MSDTFNVGDVVQLNSGSPAMTVLEVNTLSVTTTRYDSLSRDWVKDVIDPRCLKKHDPQGEVDRAFDAAMSALSRIMDTATSQATADKPETVN